MSSVSQCGEHSLCFPPAQSHSLAWHTTRVLIGKAPTMSGDMQTILVATDFSDASAPATAYAFSLARALNARVYVMHVVPEDDVRVITAIRPYLQSEVTPETLVDTFYTEAAKRLAALVEEAQATELVQERLIVTKSAEKPRHSCRGGIGVGRAGLNAQEPNKTHAVPEPSMGEGTAEREAPAFMPGRTSRTRCISPSCRGRTW